ncbi:pyridoxal phosphate-dependent aminotransferase [Sandaracinus amylolyticus]|uniref:pyridoxal phosphate-dependent aminotransferase n=1 Tax=Sandaracinus amylolyticus TaxID=927083 RepID=UPI001EFF7E32|nr:aminotransferase class I/II-fold pyridoxal phosphate-dependent enzyme [Sandaracinus amylolyticus]UJR78955.1 Histidinol-phosphate aminotransferase [Sandaracinus amylolyticus]
MSDAIRERLRPELAALHAYETPAAPARIRVDGNESPWALPAEARARIAEAMASIALHRYPDPRCTALRAALSGYVGARPDELVIGVGSDEVISILETAIARPRSGSASAVVMHPDPSFSMYGIIGRGHGHAVVKVPLDERWDLDADVWARAIDEHRPSLIFLPSPNNPTSNRFDERVVRRIVEQARDALVVLDDAYVEFSSGSISHALFEKHDNVAVLGTLSKIGLAALRVGWVRVKPWLAHELEKVRLTYNIPTPSQEIATLALGPLMPILREQIALVRAERSKLVAGLAAIPGIAVDPTDSNFALVRAGSRTLDVAARMHAAGVQVRTFAGHPRLAERMRITVGTPEENHVVLAALADAMREVA